MITISGFDALSKQLEEAQKAISQLDGDICNVNFDPYDPGSIEAAIQKMESEVDRRVGTYADNPIVAPVAAAAKETYRKAILDKAAESRLKGENDDATQD